jgi:nucleotidyltransferase/DNA polymerase involved in DNA repair
MDHYREQSREIMKLVAQTGAVIEQVSIDEAYMDLPASARLRTRMYPYRSPCRWPDS